MNTKSSEAVRPRKADNREGEWVQGVEDEEITIEEEEVVPGERKVKKMMNLLPSAREVEEHNISHLPFRNWCLIA